MTTAISIRKPTIWEFPISLRFDWLLYCLKQPINVHQNGQPRASRKYYAVSKRSVLVHTDISLQHILLSPGRKYFTTVTACNTAGVCSSPSSSDGVILDGTPPVTGTVQDGTSDMDIQFQAAR